MDDRLTKSLRAAHERHAQHLSASQTPHTDPAVHHPPAQDHACGEHCDADCACDSSQHYPAAEHHAHNAVDHQAHSHADEHHAHSSTSEHHAPAAEGHHAHPEAAPHHPHAAALAHHVHGQPAHHHTPAVEVHHPHVHHHAPAHETHPAPPAPVLTSPVLTSPVLTSPVLTSPVLTLPVVVPVVGPAPARQEPTRFPTAAAAIRNRWSRQGRVSIVGTLLLSVLISTGLFSLQLISKWRRPSKLAEIQAKAEGLDQPLSIAVAQDDATSSSEPADTHSPAANQTQVAPSRADSESGPQRGLDEFFTAAKKEVVITSPAVEVISGRAPYAPDPVDLSNASGSVADNRPVMAPESAGDRTSLLNGQPAALPSVPSMPLATGRRTYEQQTAANAYGQPPAQHGLADQPAVLSTAAVSPAAISPVRPPELDQPNSMYGQPAAPSQRFAQPGLDPSQNTAFNPLQQSANPAPLNDPYNRTAAPAPTNALPAAPQGPSVADGQHTSLDAPGPVILPGRTTGPSSPSPSSASNGASGVVPVSATAEPSPQLRDLTQPTPADATPTPATQPGSGADPVYGLFDHHSSAGALNPAHAEPSTALAALDRTKVMSFQFRNAPWTVVLSQFAAETHLELRMQSVPQGVFNRWDSARYSPSQTLGILNSELARAGCQLKLEGSVLKVCAVAPAATHSSPSGPALSTPSTSWLPQSSGIVPVSGRY